MRSCQSASSASALCVLTSYATAASPSLPRADRDLLWIDSLVFRECAGKLSDRRQRVAVATSPATRSPNSLTPVCRTPPPNGDVAYSNESVNGHVNADEPIMPERTR
jgi:hypothetical protein